MDEFEALKQAKIRVGTMDLKIASICLANDARLLTRNTADFENVPGLQFEIEVDPNHWTKKGVVLAMG